MSTGTAHTITLTVGGRVSIDSRSQHPEQPHQRVFIEITREPHKGTGHGSDGVRPSSPPLLSATGAGWGGNSQGDKGHGLLFPRRFHDANGAPHAGPYSGNRLVQPLRRALKKACVPAERWDIPPDSGDGERGKGSPTHAIRRCIRSGLIREGVEEAIVLYLVGQSQGITVAAYVPENSLEQSPCWPRLVEAVGRIPRPG